MRDHRDESEIWSKQVSECDALDRAFDAVLAKYVATPRAGIEERVMGNLRVERERLQRKLWWRWPTVVGLAAVAVVLAVSVIWRPTRPAHDFAVHHSPAITPNIPELQTHAANRRAGNPTPVYQAENRKRNSPRIISHTATVASYLPKLDRFPSSRPLSEQEQILQTYFSNYPKDAVLVSRAWAEAQRRDAEEEIGDGAGMNQQDSQQ
jgi:hypothetical protein